MTNTNDPSGKGPNAKQPQPDSPTYGAIVVDLPSPGPTLVFFPEGSPFAGGGFPDCSCGAPLRARAINPKQWVWLRGLLAEKTGTEMPAVAPPKAVVLVDRASAHYRGCAFLYNPNEGM